MRDDDHIPTDHRLKRHLTDDPRCNRCLQNADETLIHLFRDCPIARTIWKSVGGAALYPSFYGGDLKQWITRNLEAEGLIFSEKWPTCFAITLWWIWKWRNISVFGRTDDIPGDTGIFLRSQIEHTWKTFSLGADGSNKKAKEEVFIRWLAPLVFWLALNTDGAAKGAPGAAGGGGVLRDCYGKFVKAFAANFGVCNAYKAELLALEIGLNMVKQMGATKIMIEMDNKACIEAILSKDQRGGECIHILNSCGNLINSFSSNVNLDHCFREGNKVADKLANMGVVFEEKIVYFDDPPIEIKNLLWEDVLGVTSSRFVM